MNILLTSDVFPPNCGGSGWSNYFLARSFIAAGHKVKVLTLQNNQKGIKKDKFREVEVMRFGWSKKTNPARRLVERKLSLSRFASEVRSVIAKEKMDIVHSAHYLSTLGSIDAAKKKNVPFIITVRDYWPVCLYSTMIYDGKPCTGCTDDKIRKCFSDYNKKYFSLSAFVVPALKKEVQKRKEVIYSADRVVFVSGYLEKAVKKSIPDIRSVILPNGVDIDYINRVCSEPSFYEISQPYALFIGKMEPYKGTGLIKQLIENRKFNLPLVLIGTGSDYDSLIASVENNTKKAVFLNWIANDEVLKIIKRAQFLLFPSVWAEPLSRVLLESVSVGLPVIAISTGGTPEIIEDEKSGILADDEADFIEKAVRISNKPDKLHLLSKNMKKTAWTKFDQTKIAERWIRLYEETIKEKRAQTV